MIFKNKIHPIWVLFLVAILIVLPIYFNNTGMAFGDTYFHYNRIYEAAQQIRHNNFSFINLYSFQQSGRVVNQVYSPLLTYFFGGILLLVGNWFRFQVISIIVVCLLAGIFTYYGARRLELTAKTSLIVAIMYMSSFSIFNFIYSTSWRGVAAMFIPLLVGPILDLYRGDWTWKSMFFLSIAISLITQAQILAVTLILPILVPFFVIGLIKSTHKWRGVGFLSAAVVMAVVLNLNVVLPYVELIKGNTILPPANFPLMEGVTNILVPFYDAAPLSNVVISILFFMSFAGLILFWSRLGNFSKLVSIIGMVYMVLGTSLIPWSAVETSVPALGNFLQLPRRFIIVGLLFLVLGAVLILRDLVESSMHKVSFTIVDFMLTVFTIASVTSLMVTINDWNSQSRSNSAGLASGLATEKVNVFAHKLDGKKISKIIELQPAFHSANTGKLIHAVDRVTPDYTPIQKYSNKIDYYQLYVNYVIKPKNKFKHTVKKDGVMELTWNDSKAKTQDVPVVAYKNTQIKFNGKVLKHNHLKQTAIGSLLLKSQKGLNRLQISYVPNKLTLVGTAVALFGWIIAGIVSIFYLIRKRYNKFG
ncbi:hypothetical protein [Pediococcus claussenii]|uniref:Membrane protein n=1 Tax=Pediococcus claussenii (strain ATCC BAA-344 / DSM 14800 / JCM 18046 / KCTC 3811 / LMG 21948 / P06) TaxID=701521 RepID=G8PBI6_PEDCP|nr:hypothetical protein [Pediococcus claussenii]AEV94735.1 putative membrane protein [Pediococcus claussenii ATCC BAA-344]ANZ69929.1 hypothetical protein AYR57_06220 [Pediococcus claussenii]ANZ71747.1 hypothetical protein AYR58_06230 [Pediococcus claussenii]KRN20914.1 hypothetical protein IV79_GL000139 [Pediococcus claussenii]